ncbi:ABC transporter ATP-binding protein [Desulfosporosinus fructosivorans]
MGEAILKINNLNSYYGKSHVLQEVSLTVNSLERVAVLGRNGMGKSTLLKSILRLQDIKVEGDVLFKGEALNQAKTYEIAKKGIGYVPQGWLLFPSLSVEEHLLVAYRPGKSKAKEWNPERIFELFPEIAARRKVSGTKLSGGEQQILAIGRALVSNPEILLMDEPSEGISTMVIDRVIDLCHQLTEQGISILIVEQNLELALKVAQRVYVLVNGRIVYEGTAEDFRADKESQHQFLGV